MKLRNLRCKLCTLVLCLVAGLASQAGAQDKLITEGDTWSYLKGTENPDAAWNTSGFDDSSWLTGATPIGYSADLAYATVLDDMLNTYLSFYARFKFTVASPSSIKALKLRMKYDDGYVAYLNGVEILRKAMPAGPTTNTTAATDHETNAAFEDVILPCASVESLQAGPNVLAIEVHNATVASSDCSMSTELESIDSVCPTDMTCTVNASNYVVLRWKKPAAFVYDSLTLYRNDVAIAPGPVKTATSYTDRTPAAGVNNYRLVATACGVECSGGDVLTCSATVASSEPKFRRGDVDENGSVAITDAVKILGYLFKGEPAPPCLDGADVDDDSSVKITDAVFLLAALFKGGPQPPAPGTTECGVDPTADELATCASTACQ